MEIEIEKVESDLNEILSRLARLRRQRVFLKDRSSVLFRRGIREVDEEDGVRTQEQALVDEQQAVGDAQSTGCFDILDWSALVSESDLFGEFGDTVELGLGNSSGV